LKQRSHTPQAFQDLFQEDGASQEGLETRLRLSPSVGKGTVLTTRIKQGLDLTVMDYRLNRPIDLQVDDDMRETYRETYGLGFGTSGNVRTRIHDVKDPVHTCSGENCMLYLPRASGNSEAAGQKLSITICISADLFRDIAQGEFDRLADSITRTSGGSRKAPYFNKGRNTAAMKRALHQILNCPYQGVTKRIYLESRALELIVYKLEQMTAQGGVLNKAIKPDDLDRVVYAKEILTRDLESPPTLCELAGSVGLSHAKLNRCFREVYGTTVFGFLRQARLEQARFLLEEKQINVTEAALSVGYSSLSSFIQAFSDQFGIKPSLCFKPHL
jgi:AraC-like DNA-binding protein